MVKCFHSLIAATLMLFSLPSHATEALATPNWKLADAAAIAAQADFNRQLAPLYQLARQQDEQALLEGLKALADDPALAGPARDALLHRFASDLGDLPTWNGGQEIIAWLQKYPVAVHVPHDDHPRFGVPLFSVRAAASGSATRWQQQQVWKSLGRLDAQSTEQWIETYQTASATQRQVYTAALNGAPTKRLITLGDLAFEAMPTHPELAAVAATTSLLLADADRFALVLESASGPGVSAALRQATQVFDSVQQERILKHSMNKAPASNAALAMAHLAPGLVGYRDVQELLFETLEHRELGSSAALVLSASSDPRVQQRLDDVAKGKGLAAKRAALGRGGDQ